MAEQAGDQVTGIKRGHSDQQNSFIHSERSICQQHIEKGHLKMEDMMPDCPATKPCGLGTPPFIQTSCSSTQHQLQPPEFHHGPLASQLRSQRYIIAHG